MVPAMEDFRVMITADNPPAKCQKEVGEGVYQLLILDHKSVQNGIEGALGSHIFLLYLMLGLSLAPSEDNLGLEPE